MAYERMRRRHLGNQPGEAEQADEVDSRSAALQRLGSLAGNAAVAEVLSPREQVEASTGFDLSEAAVHEDSTLPGRAGVEALTVGTEIHLAPGVSAAGEHGRHVLAHEYAHVVQHATGADPRTGAERRDLEEAAEATALADRGGESAAQELTALPAPRQLAIQLFDPRYHRTSTVEGLEGSGFTPDEVGRIYAANWERDLSQAHPSLGNVILAWKSVKLAAHSGKLTPADTTKFHNACQDVLDSAVSIRRRTGSFDAFVNATAYGGYQFYEHMDNPQGTPQGDKLKVVLGGKNTSGLPDHLYVSREYIKEMLHEAAKLSHPDLGSRSTAAVAASSAATRAGLGPGPGVVTAGALPADPVAAEASIQAQSKHPGVPGGGTPLDPRAYDRIGRAAHALQDFWSHSNFVELAIGQPEFQLKGLTTGTFGDADRTHALAHKVRGVADEVEAEMPLVNRMSERSRTNPAPGDVHVGNDAPVQHDNPVEDAYEAIGQAADVVTKLPENLLKGFLRGHSRPTTRPGWQGDAEAVLNGVAGGIIGGTASVVGSHIGVFALRQLAEKIEEDTREKQEKAGDFGAHGLLAKDQPGHENNAFGRLKTAKFELAHALSVESDKLVTAKLKAVVDAPDAAEADALLRQIFTTLDALIAAPTPAHPLWAVVESHRAAAEKALQEKVDAQDK